MSDSAGIKWRHISGSVMIGGSDTKQFNITLEV